MILDENLEFCDATALNTGVPGTYLVGDVIDLDVAGRDIGQGDPLYCVISIDTTVTSGGAATVNFIIASDAAAAIATNGTAIEHFRSDDFALASLAAGMAPVVVSLPREGPAYKRYLGILQVTGTAALTAGKINAFLTHDPGRWKAYADAVN